VHTPSEENNDEEKKFYSLLESTLEGIPRGCVIILLDDFNARIGTEECFKTTTGSNNSCELIKLATGKGLKIKSLTFSHKEIHKRYLEASRWLVH